MRKIAIISPVPTHPPLAGNRARVLSLAQQIRELGHDLHFLHIQRWAGDNEAMAAFWEDRFHTIPCCAIPEPTGRLQAMRNLALRIGVPCFRSFDIDAWYDRGIDLHLRRFAGLHRPDIVIVEYVFFSRALQVFNDRALKIVDTHDVFTRRHQRLLNQGRPPSFFSTSRKQEKRGLERADVIIAIQNGERQFFESLTGKRVITVRHVPVNSNPLLPKPAGSSVLLMASANPANLDAVRFFAFQVMPLIRKVNKEARFLVAGSVCRELPDCPTYEKLGVVDDCATAYLQAKVVVNPVRSGTGLKIKTVEALGFARPVVATPPGSLGVEDAFGRGLLVGATASDLAAHVTHLLSNAAAYEAASRAAATYFAEYRSECRESLSQVLQQDLHRGERELCE